MNDKLDTCMGDDNNHICNNQVIRPMTPAERQASITKEKRNAKAFKKEEG